jgi:DASH complex subunit DAD2
MRQSLAANRASHAAPLLTNSAAAAAKLLEKKKEFDAVSALERASALYLERIEGIGEDCDIMADAGQGKIIYEMTMGLLCLNQVSAWASS